MQEEMHCTASGRLLLLYSTDVFVQYCHIDIFHCCLVINVINDINGSGLGPSNLEFDQPPQEKVAEVAISGMQRLRDLQQS